MPEIKRIEKKKNNNRKKTGKNKEIAKLYNTSKWQKLRKGYLIDHPLCEKCLENDIIEPATQVHHIKEISTGNDELEMMSIAFDPDNLMALCDSCHQKLHKEKQWGKSKYNKYTDQN